MTDAHPTEEQIADPMSPMVEKSETWEANDGVRVTTHHHRPGMTKREYYAAMAMLGFIQKGRWEVGTEGARNAAHWAAVYADALVEELSQ